MLKKVIIVIFTALMLSLILCGCSAVRKTDNAESKASASADDEVTKPDTTAEDTTAETTAEDTTEAVTTAEETTSAPVADTEPAVAVGGMYPTILTYHLILDEPYTQFTNLFVKVSDFESQLQKLCDAGYSFLFADEFGEVGGKSVILTFDDGYEDNYTNMFPLLKKYNVKATVFMITSSIDVEGYLTSDQIREMAASGLVQFGSHTVAHRDLRGLGEEEQREELASSKAVIQGLTGQEVNCICYPAGGYNSTTVALASEYYNFGFTTHRGKYNGEDKFELPRIAVQRGMSADGLMWTLGG